MLRPGSAGSNTAADHLQVADAAITAVSAKHRRRLMVICDGVGASHGLIEHLDELASRPGRELTYSVGWERGAREGAAIRLTRGTRRRRLRNPGNLALGRCHHDRLGTDQRPAAGALTRGKPSARSRKDGTSGTWNPAPGRQPDHRHTRNIKSGSTTQLSGTRQVDDRPA